MRKGARHWEQRTHLAECDLRSTTSVCSCYTQKREELTIMLYTANPIML